MISPWFRHSNHAESLITFVFPPPHMKLLIALAAGLVVATTMSWHGQDLSCSLSGNRSLLSTGATRTYTSNGVTMTAAVAARILPISWNCSPAPARARVFCAQLFRQKTIPGLIP